MRGEEVISAESELISPLPTSFNSIWRALRSLTPRKIESKILGDMGRANDRTPNLVAEKSLIWAGDRKVFLCLHLLFFPPRLKGGYFAIAAAGSYNAVAYQIAGVFLPNL